MKAIVRLVVALVLLTVLPGVANASPTGRTPVVLFPAYHLTKLKVTVNRQTTAPECAASGTFEYWFQSDKPGSYSQICKDKLLTLRYAKVPVPMPLRFSEQPGVRVDLVDYGRTTSSPAYEPMYQALESAGYQRNKDIRVAGYDARLTPDMGGFMARTKKLVEDTYYDNGRQPVHLVGHSNGPLYAQYLLTHTSRAWRAKYIHGFTPLAGNFPGQGLLYPMMFGGLNVQDFSYPTTKENAASSARMLLSEPSTYMSASDPAVFGDREVVIEAGGRSYTPRDYPALFANLPQAKEIADYYIGFVRLSYPHVDVYAEKGSGLPTVVGARLPDLTVGQVLDTNQFLTRDGDGNQEDITNDAILKWRTMPCFRFSLTDNPGVDHFSLTANPNVLDRLLTHLRQPRSNCR